MINNKTTEIIEEQKIEFIEILKISYILYCKIIPVFLHWDLIIISIVM